MLSTTRIASIRAKLPSEARIARFMEAAAGIRAIAIELAYADHIAWAEAQQTRTTWNCTPVRRGRKGIIPFAECLTPEQARIAGIGIHDQRTPEQWQADMAAAHDAVRFGITSSGQPSAGDAPTAYLPQVGASFLSSQKKVA